ncbi:unnamed protein product [Closterium sp. NIES-53]
MHAVTDSAEGDCYLSVPLDPGIEAAALGASASAAPGASSQVFAAASRSSPTSAPCSYRPPSHETLLWHHRLGHPSLPRLRGMASRTLVSGLPRSLPPLPPGPAPTCVPCVEGRQRAAPHSSTFPPTEAPLQTLHMDVWGPARVRGQGHERYFLLVIDDYSRYTTVFPLRSKGEVTEVLIDWIRGARRQLSERFCSNRPVLRLHSDRGDPVEPVEVAVDSGAARGAEPAGEGTGGAEPGVAESGSAESGGAEPGAGDPGAEGSGAVSAVSGGAARPRPYYVSLLQQVLGLPSSTGPSPPLLSPPPVQSQSQLQPASPLLGPSPYSGPTRGLMERREPESRPVSPESRPASPESRFASLVRTVHAGLRFWRSCPPPVPGTHSMTLRPSTSPLCSTAASALVAELVDFAAAYRQDYAASRVAECASASVCPPSIGGESALGTDVLDDRQEEFECFAAAVPHLVCMLLAPEGDPDVPNIPTPRSYAEAIEGSYSSQWQAAMDGEMAFWKSTGTYVDEVPQPEANIVNGMWTLRRVNFFETFSPAPKMTTLQHSLPTGSLHEEIWLRRPPGFTGLFLAGTQWSLRRPVYGFRQAPREWHDTLRTTLVALGFAPSTADLSLFLRTDTTLPPFYVLVYVDDLVFATADIEAFAHVKSELQKRHTCTDLGELTSCLGLRITWDRAQRTITLTQSHMVQQVLQHFGFTYSSQPSTPLPTGPSLSALPSDESVEPSGPYPELVGCLMYLMTCTRPDLAYPLSLLARYAAPGRHRKVHWDAAKRVLRYLCSTSGMGLVLGGRARVVLTGHADASWVDDLTTQRSSQGYTFSLGSGSVSWWSTHSSSVLSSSCEAEIYAGAMAAQELDWLIYLLTNLGEAPRSPPVLYVDNKAMLALC